MHADGSSGAPIDRIVMFTDASVAIALTLLILPLMDAISTHEDGSPTTLLGFLNANWPSLMAFVLSFVVIARFWRSHHRLFLHVERDAPGLFWVNTGWLAAIVLLPVATVGTSRFPDDPGEYVFYIGLMIVASLLQTLLAHLVCRHPAALAEGAQPPLEHVIGGITTTALLVLALVLAVCVPAISYFALLVLFFARPAGTLTRRIVH